MMLQLRAPYNIIHGEIEALRFEISGDISFFAVLFLLTPETTLIQRTKNSEPLLFMVQACEPKLLE